MYLVVLIINKKKNNLPLPDCNQDHVNKLQPFVILLCRICGRTGLKEFICS